MQDKRVALVYPASKAALNAMSLAMMVELESTRIKVRIVSPAFTSTNLNNYVGTETVEDGSRQLPTTKARGLVPGATSPAGIRDVWPTDTGPGRRTAQRLHVEGTRP
jgi:short-subunit dehydrogenase